MFIGRTIFYDITTGIVIYDTGEYKNAIKKKTPKEHIETHTALIERVRESFDFIELEYGQYAQDWAESNGYRVNPETKTIEFSYPDPTEPEDEQPYQAPLSEQVAALQQENLLLKAQNNALTERTDFHEEVLTEIILTISS